MIPFRTSRPACRKPPNHRPGGVGPPFVFLLPFFPLLAACATQRSASGPAIPEPDLPGIVQEAIDRTMPEGPVQITFGFRLREADLRFSGRGVARVEPPYRLRIDLFSNRGEELFRAALVGSEMRVPPGVPLDLAPPPSLLWAAVGVFRPDAELRLRTGGRNGGTAITLSYGGGAGQDLRFRLSDLRLAGAELYEDGRLIEEVGLERDEASHDVVETRYRNYPMFLELVFSLETVEYVDAFPLHIWYPGG